MSKAKIEVYTSPTCPHCPHAKKVVGEFAKDNEEVKFVEVSTATHDGQKRAQRMNIRSVPTLVITGPGTSETIGYVGVPSNNQLKKMIDIALGKDDFEEAQETGFKRFLKKILG